MNLVLADSIKEDIFTMIMGWFLGCFGRNKERRARSIRAHAPASHRSKFSNGHTQTFQQKSTLRLGSGLLPEEEGRIKYEVRLGKASGNFATVSTQNSEALLKNSYLNRVHELEEELATLRRTLAAEAKDAQKLREEVRDFNTHSIDKQQKISATDSEDELFEKNGFLIGKIKLQSPGMSSAVPAVCDPQQAKETFCTQAKSNPAPAKTQTINSESKEEPSSDPIGLSSGKQPATAVKISAENDKTTAIPRKIDPVDANQAKQATPNIPQLSLSSQAWSLRCMWRQPLSPVHETDSLMSSEGDSCRQSGCSLSVSSSLSRKHSTEAEIESERKPSDVLDQSSVSIGKPTSCEEACSRKINSLVKYSDSNYETSHKNLVFQEIAHSSVDFNVCDDDEFDMVPIQCPSPQFAPKSKKHPKTISKEKEAKITRLSSSPVSASPLACGKENWASTDQDFADPNIHDASHSRDNLETTAKISQVQVRQTSSILKPVENLSQWRKLKQTTNDDETCSFYHQKQVLPYLGFKPEFHNGKDSGSSLSDSTNCNNLVCDSLLQKQRRSTFGEQTKTVQDNAGLDDSGRKNWRGFSCSDFGSCGSFSEFGGDFECLDFESSSIQLNEDTTDSAISRIYEEFKAACLAKRAALFGEETEIFAAGSEISSISESECISAESASCASPNTNSNPQSCHHAIPKSPTERPIVGTVAAHWACTESAEPRWDGKGIPNSTTKYKEDQKVSWHATPFEVRLERALATEVKPPQRNLLRLMV